jgi:hypothetical protein
MNDLDALTNFFKPKISCEECLLLISIFIRFRLFSDRNRTAFVPIIISYGIGTVLILDDFLSR